jgi:hypothetical protein
MAKPDFDPYAVLGVARSATPDEIKAAYRAQVAKYHPDHHQGNPLEELAEIKLAELNRAYEILSDSARRAACDAAHPTWPAGPPFHARGVSTPGRKRWLFLLGLLLMLPLLVRLVVFLARTLFQAGAEVFAAARGTPLLLALLVVLVAGAIFLFVRRRRR